MSEAQKLMAEVMQRHARFERWEDDQGGTSWWAGYECGDDCDWRGKTVSEYFEHVAAEIDKALGGLTRQIAGPDGCAYGYARWVSGWTEVTE